MRPLSIRTRLILLITVIACGLLGGILGVVYHYLNAAVESKVRADFSNTQDFFRRQELLVYDRLIESCWLIGQNPAFKANVALGHAPSVREAVEELAGFTKTDLFLVTDPGGEVLYWLDRPDQSGRSALEWPGIQESLQGDANGSAIEEPLLWAVGGQLYQVVTVPVEVDGSLLGSLTLGTRFTDYEAADLKGSSPIDIHIFLDSTLIGTSMDRANPTLVAMLESFVTDFRTEISGAMRPGSESAVVFTGPFRGRETYVAVRAMGQGAPGYYLAMADKSAQLTLLGQLFRTILLIGASGFLLALLLAVLLGNQFTRPVLEMVAAMDRVSTGDLEVKLQPRSRDEYGRLTAAFNEMIRALRERLQLSRYVGSHTMQMIRSASGADSDKGQRLDMAVLFSDIRGFTAYSEGREPEEVIAMLNAWLGFQSRLVLDAGGVVDKFVGDEVVALFIGEAAMARAWHCAGAIQLGAARLARERAEDLAVGIGLHYGPVVMGNVGAGDRLDYTVIGSTVNLSARLCSAAGRGEVVFTAEAAARIPGFEEKTTTQQLQLKGIARPVPIFRINTFTT